VDNQSVAKAQHSGSIWVFDSCGVNGAAASEYISEVWNHKGIASMVLDSTETPVPGSVYDYSCPAIHPSQRQQNAANQTVSQLVRTYLQTSPPFESVRFQSAKSQHCYEYCESASR